MTAKDGGAHPGAPTLPERVDATRLALVYELTPRSLLASFAASVICAVFFTPGKPPLATLTWWLALSGVTLLRYRLVRRFRASNPAPAEGRAWGRRAVLGAGVAGALWGGCLVLLAPPWGSPGYPLAVFLVAGIPAVGLASNSALFPVYFAFLLPILLPYALKLFLLGGGEPWQILGGVAALIYTAALAAIGRAASRNIADAVELRLKNHDLVQDATRVNEELRAEIARREAAERVLITAKEVAEGASEAKSRFLAKMSHEIRTPMNAVIGMTELLKESSLTPEQRRYAEHVDEAARSLLQIVDDILDVARVEAGRLKLEHAVFDLRATVAAAVRLLEGRARQKGLRLNWAVAEAAPAFVRGDAGRLRQVLVNLVGNALKFTETGSVRVSADVAGPASDRGCTLRFEVVDTGIGIPEEAQARLFDPFVQVDESASRRFGGAGLGLTICRQLVTAMGGTISVESRPGAGARFAFTARFGLTDEPAPAGDAPGSPSPRAAVGGRVLLVEDNPVNREIAQAMLTSLGCEVDVAEEGGAAVALAGRRRYDAILMDCEMPGLDGYDATRAIRTCEAGAAGGRRVPIIALTASALDTDRRRALESGMDEHMAKPFGRDDLRRALVRWWRPVAELAP